MNERLEVATIDGQREIVFRGTSIRIDDVLDRLSEGESDQDILARFSQLQPEDLNAARDHDREMTRRWADTWAKARPELERFRRQELRALQGGARRKAITAVLSACPSPEALRTKVTSGLVEFYRVLMKARA